MISNDVQNAFMRALDELGLYNQLVQDYWITELCEDDGELSSLDESKLTVENLVSLQNDLKEQMELVEAVDS